MPRIEVRIPRRGAVQMEGFEFQGGLCRQAVDPFLQRLAGRVETDILKPEYRSVNEIHVGNGEPDASQEA